MTDYDMPKFARKTPVTRLMDTEAQLDMARLRGYRLGRVREQLKQHDCGACVLLDQINIRYATGSRNMPLFNSHVPNRYAFVPAEGPVVLFEIRQAQHVAEELETVDECRLIRNFTFFGGGPRAGEGSELFADDIADLVRQHGGGNKRLAIDRCDPKGMVALIDRGLELFDAQEPMERARIIKSGEEILCMNESLAVAEIGMARMREAMTPGMTENEMYSILHQTNIAMGGEWIETRLLTSGDRVNPWLQQCSDRRIRAGELVAFDTDMVGPFGYCADISRTYYCGPGKPTAAQRDLYKLAHEEVYHNIDLVKPGLSFREFTEKAWKQPAQFVANRYPALAHGIGMCDEYPTIFYPPDWETEGYDGVVEENMTLCIESYIGPEGGKEGVKLEQQVLVTATGVEVLSKFPFEDELLN